MSKYQKLIRRKIDGEKIVYTSPKPKVPELKEEYDNAKYKAHRLFSEISVPEKIGHIYCPVCGAATQKWIGSKGMVDICWNCRQIKKE